MIDHYLTDPTFWVAIGTLLFAVLVFKAAKAFLLSSLDGRTARIQAELDRATALRAEAEALLATYQRQYEEAVAASEAIVARAQADAEQMAATMQSELQASMEKRRQMAEAKIAQAEANALQAVQQHIIDIAIGAAREVITHRLASGQGEEMVRLATSELQRKLH